jgi:hypothetical protein
MNCCKLLLILLCCCLSARAQDTTAYHVTLINKEKLQAMQATAGKCLLLELWIPNCATAHEQFNEFAGFEKTTDLKIVYLGVTNDPKKIINIAAKYGYTDTLYMLDTAICPDIYKRFDIFCDDMHKAYKSKHKGRFNGMLIGTNGRLLFTGELLGFPAWLRKKC